MSCCVCEKYKLLEDRKTIYTDSNGQDYCWLHAPAEEKGMNQQEFSMRVYGYFEAIQYAEPDYEGNVPHPDFTGAIFPWDISFWLHDTDGSLPYCNFTEAVFMGDVDLSNTDGSYNFTNARFEKKLSFQRATINRTTFRFTEFRGNADFKYSTFKGTPTFRKAHFFSEADFNNCNFEDGASFRYSSFDKKANFFRCFSPNNKIHLQLVDVTHLSFSCRETPFFQFQTCTWPEKLLPELTGNFKPEANEDLYRSLKLIAADEHNMPMVSRWHYNEKRMALKQIPKRLWPFSVTWWYYISSGFGEKPVRAFYALLVLVLLPLVVLSLLKLTETGITGSFDMNAIDEVSKGWLMSMPLTKISMSVPSHHVGFLWFYWLSQLFISIQAALFGFAMRNRFRR